MNVGLLVFVVTVAVDVLTLLVDLWLYRTYGYDGTVTAHVQLMPVLGIPLLAWQMTGTLGLAYHLWVYQP